MKTTLLSLAFAALTLSASAQVFQPNTARNVLIGSIAGAVIGENNDRPVEGAVIGAAAGYAWSVATGADRDRAYAPPVPVHYRERVVVTPAPICEPPRRRVVVVERPVIVVPPPPRVIVHSHRHHPRRGHYHRVYEDCRPPRRVVYEYPSYRRW